MKLYLAGGIQANCKPLWTAFLSAVYKGGKELEVYLAGTQGRRWCIDEYMKLYLAGTMYGNMGNYIARNVLERIDDDCLSILQEHTQNKNMNYASGNEKHKKIDIAILESFYYADEWTEKVIPLLDHFLLDSGAFTFMSNSKKGNINWKDYIDRYIAFINKNNVKHFFELDIDCIVGYENVLRIRKYIEEKTGKKCIPVWHKSRGKDEFLKMCDEYDYVSIGGIVSKEIKQTEYPFFTWFINEAHKRGCKIHGLGFTNLKGLEKYKFDSVDSTSWTTGNRFGCVYMFNGKTIVKHDKKQGQRLADSRAVAVHNFNEWVKFQKYAEKNL